MANPAIKTHRERVGLTQEALGKELGVSAVTVWRWENGDRAPKRTRWPRLRELIGIPFDDLISVPAED